METIYILGSGAIGFPLAVYLARAGRPVVAVRTSRADVPRSWIEIRVHGGAEPVGASVETVSLSHLDRLDGMIAICVKSHANAGIAEQLKKKGATGPFVLLQNGVGVEKPFLETGLSRVYRCVLYTTAQARGEAEFTFRPIQPSPIGVVQGDPAELERCVERLSTEQFPFRAEENIEREVWKKAILNSVFNSICPLLETDNGIFVRDEQAAGLARGVVRECLSLTERLGLGLTEIELMEQLQRISRGSSGQLISTLQDIRMGRPTEIESLNLEIARVAASLEPPLALPRTELLGRMTLIKSQQPRP